MPLHELDPTGRFSSRAGAYGKYRPDYAAALFEVLLDPQPDTVADIGAGTGISSRQLAERGVRVFAVEPNAEMRRNGERHPGITWIDGSAEESTLESASVDLVTCFQAFHWFQPDSAISEFLRILKQGGRIAAIWNERDSSDPFTRSYGDLVREISQNHPAEAREQTADALYRSKLLGSVRKAEFPHQQPLDLAGLIGRAASTSYLPAEGPRHDELLQRLGELFETWSRDGRIVLRYVTSLYLTTRRDEPVTDP